MTWRNTSQQYLWMEEPVPERHLCIHENSQHEFESTTLHTRSPTAHRPQWHLWVSWCHSNCQQWWCTQPRRYPWTLKKIQNNSLQNVSSWRRTLNQPVMHSWITCDTLFDHEHKMWHNYVQFGLTNVPALNFTLPLQTVPVQNIDTVHPQILKNTTNCSSANINTVHPQILKNTTNCSSAKH